MTHFTAQQKHECAVREVALRKRVYDNLVNVGKFTRENADKQIALMQEIADDYAAQVKKERLL